MKYARFRVFQNLKNNNQLLLEILLKLDKIFMQTNLQHILPLKKKDTHALSEGDLHLYTDYCCVFLYALFAQDLIIFISLVILPFLFG